MLLRKVFCLAVSHKVISRIIRESEPRKGGFTFAMISSPRSPAREDTQSAMSIDIEAKSRPERNCDMIKSYDFRRVSAMETRTARQVGRRAAAMVAATEIINELNNVDMARSMPP